MQASLTSSMLDSMMPMIRIQRNCTEQMKSLCATVSSTAHISAKKARTVIQVVCRDLYGHQFYLNVDEAKRSKEKSEYIALNLYFIKIFLHQ